MGRDLPEDGFLVASSHDASLLLPVPEHDQRRDAHDAVLPRRLGIVVHVELCGLEVVGVVAGDLLDHGGDHVAGNAPLRPEIHEDGPVGPEDQICEVPIRHMYDVVSHSASSSHSNS